MLEFLVALLIFSLSMMGLLAAQLAGKRAGFDAAQRSVAVVLARDMLERMRSNPAHIDGYRAVDLGNRDRRQTLPARNCDTTACSAVQLSAFDLWQWEALLLGENERGVDGGAAGLVAPRACITTAGGLATVSISWSATPNGPEAQHSPCAGSDAAPDDEPSATGGITTQRRLLTISTFIGRW